MFDFWLIPQDRITNDNPITFEYSVHDKFYHSSNLSSTELYTYDALSIEAECKNPYAEIFMRFCIKQKEKTMN